jgi:hypothetical protein
MPHYQSIAPLHRGMEGDLMKYIVEIGIDQHPENPNVDFDYAKKALERLRSAGIEARRDQVNANIVNGIWEFEGVLEDRGFIPSRAAIVVSLAQTSYPLAHLSIMAPDCYMEGCNRDYQIGPEKASLLPLDKKRGTLLYVTCGRYEPYPSEDMAIAFQKLCELFTLQTSLYKEAERGAAALGKHHRHADARESFIQIRRLALRGFKITPALP